MQKTITTILALLMVSGCTCNLEKVKPCTGSVVKGCVPTVYFDFDKSNFSSDLKKASAQSVVVENLEKDIVQPIINEDLGKDSAQLLFTECVSKNVKDSEKDVKEAKKDTTESKADENLEKDLGQLKLSADEEYLKGWAVDKMKRWSTMEMRVVGYADSRGGFEYNMKLAQRRAETVRDFLVSQGIDAKRITVESKGNTELLTEDAAHQDLNRRVEIHMYFPRRFGIF